MSAAAYTPLRADLNDTYTIPGTPTEERYIKRNIIFFIVAYFLVMCTETPFDIISILLLSSNGSMENRTANMKMLWLYSIVPGMVQFIFILMSKLRKLRRVSIFLRHAMVYTLSLHIVEIMVTILLLELDPDDPIGTVFTTMLMITIIRCIIFTLGMLTSLAHVMYKFCN